MAHELLITSPDRTSQRVTLESDVLLLGRSHSNDICFPDDASLSRKHLKLTVDSEGCWAEDLGSKNGTLLNGARLTARTRIGPGDRLSVGQLTVSSSTTTARAVPPTPTSSSPRMRGRGWRRPRR